MTAFHVQMNPSIIAPKWQIAGAIALMAAVLIGVSVYNQFQRYDETLSIAARETRNASMLAAEHTAQSLETIGAILTAAAALRDEVAAGQYRDTASIYALLKSIHGDSRLLRSVSWTDAAGNRLVTSQFANPPPLNVADQEHFIALR